MNDYEKPELYRYCCFCERAEPLCDEAVMLCRRVGVVARDHCCRKFVYDPLKRAPSTLPALPGLTEDDVI